ncbi:uncharacterized protein PV09_01880 [Verruconis gallopava]|uniref:Uncharacterized protein n=1 Tax=Verruconis gallopava TaxID=253628 RepID=A0A0D1XYY6_9PEZI|nr:uncharacterized protein PV09_01880 [Verruconis gallopava]KIW07981.1 hypothetical protein PV09_01880 [Verruconis gallopava]
MTKPECPISSVEDALAPYIHTREKTTRIRQILTQLVKKNVENDSEPTHVALSLPLSSIKLRDSTGLAIPIEGLYKQYFKALEAYRQARERYDTIKDELNHVLQKDAEQEQSVPKAISTEIAREYADLLRQRRQQRKMEIVQTALANLLDAKPNIVSLDMKSSIRDMLGDPPQPPMTTLEGGGDADAKVQELTFQLKKELLIAKSKLSEAKTAEEAAKNRQTNGATDIGEKVSVLREARDELISWVEGELAKIPEDEVEASQVELSFIGEEDDDVKASGSNLSNDEVTKRVEELYSQYVVSRQRYIAEVEAALNRAPKLEVAEQTGAGANKAPAAQRVMQPGSESRLSPIQASQLLPYLTIMTSTTRDEALLQQQISHLRRQLILASDETNNIIQRLAGESLLVPPDSTQTSSWAKAAGEASEKTKSLVLEQMIEGEASVAQAKRVLEGLKARRKALEGLKRPL